MGVLGLSMQVSRMHVLARLDAILVSQGTSRGRTIPLTIVPHYRKQASRQSLSQTARFVVKSTSAAATKTKTRRARETQG